MILLLILCALLMNLAVMAAKSSSSHSVTFSLFSQRHNTGMGRSEQPQANTDTCLDALLSKVKHMEERQVKLDREMDEIRESISVFVDKQPTPAPTSNSSNSAPCPGAMESNAACFDSLANRLLKPFESIAKNQKTLLDAMEKSHRIQMEKMASMSKKLRSQAEPAHQPAVPSAPKSAASLQARCGKECANTKAAGRETHACAWEMKLDRLEKLIALHPDIGVSRAFTVTGPQGQKYLRCAVSRRSGPWTLEQKTRWVADIKTYQEAAPVTFYYKADLVSNACRATLAADETLVQVLKGAAFNSNNNF